MLTVKGVVLAQRRVGEHDQYIDILTDTHGVLEVLVKGASKINSKSGCATQLFAYSAFCLQPVKKGYRLNSVAPIQIFYDLRSSVSAVALAAYFSQVLQFSMLPQKQTPEILRLLLNCLHFLAHRTHPEAMIKAIFELRLASLIGFMPDVIMCRACGCYLPEQLIFSIDSGFFCCQSCLKEEGLAEGLWIPMPAAVLQCIRHIVLSEFEVIFSFRLAEHCQKTLFAFAEQFLIYHIDRKFPALEYYQTITQPLASSSDSDDDLT